MKKSKPYFNLILNQNVGFDVLAAFSKGLTRHGIRHRFVYPHPKGPLQGSVSEAREFLASYGIKKELLLDLGNVFLRIFHPFILRRARTNIVQTPYLKEHFHPKFLRSLMKGGNVAYANYGLNLSGYADYHFSLASYKEFSNVFACSNLDMVGFEQAGIDSARLTQIGSPLVFELALAKDPFFLKEAGRTVRIL